MKMAKNRDCVSNKNASHTKKKKKKNDVVLEGGGGGGGDPKDIF